MVKDNEITQAHDPPPWIATIQENLKNPRLVTPRQQAFVGSSRDETISRHVVACDTDSDFDPSDAEVVFYLSLFSPRSRLSNLAKAISRKPGAEYFEHIASYLCEAYTDGTRKPSFLSQGQWPISFIGRVNDTRYSYTPCSDFLFLVGGGPLLFIEVCSDRANERDRYRMLLQAGLIVRVMNSTLGKEKRFTAVAIYNNAAFAAERYLVYQPDRAKVYQPDRAKEPIHYVVDEFPLSVPSHAFEFFYQLHNLPAAIPANYGDVAGHLEALRVQVKGENLKGYTGKDTGKDTEGANKKRKLGEPGPGGLSRNLPIDNPSTVRRLLGAGYEVLREEDPGSGWVLLNPLKSTLSRAKRSTGEIVMLKLVESDELRIHSFLDNVKSQDNHTIALLDQVALETKTIIVMPEERMLRDVPVSVFKASGNDIAHQFLEGVRFMHKNKVAHLDLKPENILVTKTTSPLRLHINDYGESLQVDTEESWVEGYRGTKGWAAPEVQDKQYQPIRADLWSAGQVLQYIAHCQHADTPSPSSSPSPFKYKSLAKKLLRRNPLERPLLSNIVLNHEFPPNLPLKRKRSVDRQEAEVDWIWSPSVQPPSNIQRYHESHPILPLQGKQGIYKDKQEDEQPLVPFHFEYCTDA